MNEIQVNQKLEIDRDLLDINTFHQWAGMEVNSEAAAEMCGERLGIIAARRKQIDEKRDTVLKPLKQATRAFEALVREALAPINAIDQLLRGRLSGFMDLRQRALEEAAQQKRLEEVAQEQKKQEEAASIALETGSEAAAQEAEQRAKNLERIAQKPIAVSQTMRLEGVTVAQTMVWEWTVTDENKVPKEYFVLDEKKLNAIAKGYTKEPKDIPGIEFKKVTRLSVGG